jgi:hypothetical protein
MKITLNLAVSPSFRERYALTWSVPTALLALLVLIALAHSLEQGLRAYRKVKQELVEPQRRAVELAEREAELRRSLERPEFRATLLQAQLVNSLIEKKQLSLSALAIEVADLLPPEARLSGLALVRSSNASLVKFQVNGKNAQALETFLGNLQDSPDFEDPAFGNEGFEQQGPAAGEVTMTCTARYVGPSDDEGSDAEPDEEQPAKTKGTPGGKTAGPKTGPKK